MMVPFYTRFPEVAERETRTIAVMNKESPLAGRTVGFVESFCDEPDCDCRRVFLNVFSGDGREHLATIGYGWEDREFYRRWAHDTDDEEWLDDIKGPCLEAGQYQGDLAPTLRDLFEEALLADEPYVNRIARHYRVFKKAVQAEAEPGASGGAEKPARTSAAARTNPSGSKTSRNAPCPCGSGRKYKKCCMGK